MISPSYSVIIGFSFFPRIISTYGRYCFLNQARGRGRSFWDSTSFVFYLDSSSRKKVTFFSTFSQRLFEALLFLDSIESFGHDFPTKLVSKFTIQVWNTNAFLVRISAYKLLYYLQNIFRLQYSLERLVFFELCLWCITLCLSPYKNDKYDSVQNFLIYSYNIFSLDISRFPDLENHLRFFFQIISIWTPCSPVL